jgi:hypothetical protein
MGVRAGGQVVILPILANRLPEADLELWLLFSNVTVLVMMASFGFDVTFIRLIAYGLAGRRVSEMRDLSGGTDNPAGSPADESTLVRIIAFLRRMFLRIALCALAVAIVPGSLALSPTVARSSNPSASWLSWGIVSVGCFVAVYGLVYTSILQGFNRIALLRRWEAIFGLGAVVSVVVAVLVSPSLLTAVAVWQAFGLAAFARNHWLAHRIKPVQAAKSVRSHADKELWDIAWPVAWRSGATTLGSHGLIQASGIIYSLLPNPAQLAGYLLSLRLFQILYQIAGVPFHSHVPLMARLRASGTGGADHLQIARKVMRRVYATVVLGVAVVAFLGNPILRLVSPALQLDPMVWWTLGFALLFQLYGGMLASLYALSNRVFGHIAIIVFGLTYYGFGLVLTPQLSDFGLALALLIGCVAAAAYAAWKTYPALGIRAWHFERGVSLPALYVLGGLFLVAIIFQH